MKKISNEAVESFAQRMDASMKRVGGGKVAVDSMSMRALVREEPEVAARVAEIYCMMGQSNHAYFQGALLIATAYFVEFQDDSVMRMVHERAESAGADEVLQRIGVMDKAPTTAEEPPERTAAKEWWRQSGRQDGRCDECNRALIRGEGYQVRGPVYQLDTPDGPRKIDMGMEIICEECFRKTQGGKVWR
jgi:hypothetical protein